ncbi:MAG: NUDIX domain-containing protein [Burkholderiaceae bacterium]|nr:NUDIX domain-containing protein [Burkholderiaceae bacterium]
MKALSCGILVLHGEGERGELLLCHVTGAWHWDIPKGGVERGETPQAAALRETQEECGLDLSGAPLLDLGRMPYQRVKDLHLFALRTTRFDVRDCRCRSRYQDPWGRARPEMDGFEWTPFERVLRRCARHMGELLTQRVLLPELLARLSGPEAPAPWPAQPLPDRAA